MEDVQLSTVVREEIIEYNYILPISVLQVLQNDQTADGYDLEYFFIPETANVMIILVNSCVVFAATGTFQYLYIIEPHSFFISVHFNPNLASHICLLALHLYCMCFTGNVTETSQNTMTSVKMEKVYCENEWERKTLLKV